MAKIRVGLNGFGRIGRCITRILGDHDDLELVLINTRTTPNDLMAYLLQYDSTYRKFNKNVTALPDGLMIGDQKVATSLRADASSIQWDEHGVDIVIDATGAYLKSEELEHHFDMQEPTPDADTIASNTPTHHIRGTVKKVILTAPAKDESIPHIVLGVNDEGFDWSARVISNASCTTNCAAPMFKILHDAFGVRAGFLTTAHAVTSTQALLDDANHSADRSRAAFENIAPSTTGAAKAVVRVIPALTGLIDGMSIRVPVPTVSFTDISAVVTRPVTVEDVHAAFMAASEASMKGYLAYETTPLVSSDYIGNPYSCTYDANYTKVLAGGLVKIFGWYDNEWGYSSRIVDLVAMAGSHL